MNMLCMKICPHCLWIIIHTVTIIPEVWIGQMDDLTETRVFLWDVSPMITSAELQWFSIDNTEGTPPVPVPSTTDGDLEVDLHDALSATNLIDYYCTATNSFGAARTVPFRAYSSSMYVLCLSKDIQSL